MYYKTSGYRIFSIFNYTLLTLICISCVLPLLHILAVSFSGSAPANSNLVGLLPIDFNVEAYTKTLNNSNFHQALSMGVYRTLLGTFVGMVLIVLAAYALSKDSHGFRSRSFYTWYFLFTMLFSGGIVPAYMLIRNLDLMNSIWALVLPVAVNVFNMVLMMNFFRAVPKELEEASLIDGAGHFRTLWSVFLPISMPALATISLFTMVFHWNSWFDGLLFITDYKKYPLSTFLQTVIVQQDFNKINPDVNELKNISQRTVKSAQIFIGTLPILLVYPFLQKYFVKGIILGAVKE
ncbi:binding-protein-dependent transporters inner membrane component [Paenibacillus algicola]|uniref:Binding-protein-dependent transporters inner membrane component n=1 Tax=Paenibacillus algicola TaxID=2565926 RepID=A0A4P8XGI2_9BACL|nr:carbohydrate ABC transporter permease [Paenibacillus algicola]QCT01562.1 binding-protein-dependent transporters inner membrane component [Paenibacillus algicola]